MHDLQRFLNVSSFPRANPAVFTIRGMHAAAIIIPFRMLNCKRRLFGDGVFAFLFCSLLCSIYAVWITVLLAERTHRKRLPLPDLLD